MGGENSMVTDDIKTLLFEAACFDGTNIRLTTKRIGLATDAAAKFVKGLDPNLAEQAINRACQLIEELGCGKVVDGMVDVYPNPVKECRFTESRRAIQQHMIERLATFFCSFDASSTELSTISYTR